MNERGSLLPLRSNRREVEEPMTTLDAAVKHIGLVLRTARRDAANRAAGTNAITHAFTHLEHIHHQIEGLESVRRCNDPDPNGDGMTLCDLWPDRKGPHVNVSAFDEGCLEWRNRG